MKEGWEYKKLGEVCKVLNGLWTGKKEPFVNIAVIRNTNFSKDCKLKLDDVAYIDVEQRAFSTRKLQVGDIIIEKSGGSDKQPVGRPVLFNISDGEYSFSNFTSTLRLIDKGISPRFLHLCLYAYYRNGETRKMQSKTTGLHNLDMKAYLRLPVPYFSLSEQERIASELDLLTSIIEKQKAQLKELDTLAQSIFYNMFGDPIENPKGWEVIALKQVIKVIGGYAFKSDEFKEEGIPVLRIGNINIGVFRPTNLVFWERTDKLQRYLLFPGDLVMSLTGTVGKSDYGNVCILDNSFNEYYLNQRNAKLKIEGSIDKYYLSFVLKIDAIKNRLTGISRGVRQANISNKDIENLKIPLPPLSLQQSFAEKIEAIEAQKARINESITDTQRLFDYTMDKYFG